MFESFNYTKNGHFTTANKIYIITIVTGMVCINSVRVDQQ